MCWEMDYLFFAELEKAKKAEVAKEERAGVIRNLLNNANKQVDAINSKAASVNENMPAK